jgi:phosphoribosylformylglycinamidine synthase
MNRYRALILTGDGLNCENETAFAFRMANFDTSILTINEILSQPNLIHQYHLIAFPGGFSFGDEINSGQILALKLKFRILEELTKFLTEKKLIIGICNGFQVLIKLGLLPYSYEKRSFSLTHNRQQHFINKWVELSTIDSHCHWTQNLPSNYSMPIRHGEGNIQVSFNLNEEEEYNKLKKNGHIVFEYEQDINGSLGNIAALTDSTGQVLGMMPHPEAAVLQELYPFTTEQTTLSLFQNAYKYCEQTLKDHQ